MSDISLKLYQHLPYPLRVVAASARGYCLRRWRYGPETEYLWEKALERETWSPSQWGKWQEDRLAYLLHLAATQVPFYRDYWSRRRQHGDRVSPEKLENWPVLRKDSLRQNPKAFLVEGIPFRSLFQVHTSGTMGKPLRLWRGRRTNKFWYAVNEARLKTWNGISKSDRWAILGGQLVAHFQQESPPFWVWNAGLRQLYMSSYHLAPQNAPAYLEAIQKYDVKYLLGYASSLHSLAVALLDKGVEVPNVKVALSNAEALFDHQRELIEKAFGCPVRDTYGMAEIVVAGSECGNGNMHLWPEVGVVEVFDPDEDQPVECGNSGRLICTGLINEEMPLIRYEVGDMGTLAPTEQTCECGRTLPILSKIEGRMDDVIITRDGRRVGRLDPVFKGDFPILEAQIIQESLDLLRVRFVTSSGFDDRNGKVLVARLQDRVGDMKIVLEPVTNIPRSANGKFRAVISRINDHP